MSEINEIIDGLIFIKDGTKVMSERETINKACDILAKVERGELVEVVRCKDCNYYYKERNSFYKNCCSHGMSGLTERNPDDYCSFGERSGENV